jgi:hypothetical protein
VRQCHAEDGKHTRGSLRNVGGVGKPSIAVRSVKARRGKKAIVSGE